jgi:uncharacterized membrane protein YphA (DoxX/SURF4 family)
MNTMNILLWVLQVLAALLYAASGVMKVFMFDKVSKDVPSFGALPRGAWTALGILELVCTVGLIVPAALGRQPQLTIVAATVLAIESLVFIGVHIKYREIPPIIMSGVLGLLMAFLAYGRLVLQPIFGPAWGMAENEQAHSIYRGLNSKEPPRPAVEPFCRFLEVVLEPRIWPWHNAAHSTWPYTPMLGRCSCTTTLILPTGLISMSISRLNR